MFSSCAGLGLGGRREDRLGQAMRSPARPAAARRRPRRLAGTPPSPSRPGSRAPRLHRQRPQPLDEHRTAARPAHARRPRRRSAGSSPVRWFGTTCARRSNQNSAMRVSSRPLPGMGWPMITSKAEMRSLATISSARRPPRGCRAPCRGRSAAANAVVSNSASGASVGVGCGVHRRTCAARPHSARSAPADGPISAGRPQRGPACRASAIS